MYASRNTYTSLGSAQGPAGSCPEGSSQINQGDANRKLPSDSRWLGGGLKDRLGCTM